MLGAVLQMMAANQQQTAAATSSTGAGAASGPQITLTGSAAGAPAAVASAQPLVQPPQPSSAGAAANATNLLQMCFATAPGTSGLQTFPPGALLGTLLAAAGREQQSAASAVQQQLALSLQPGHAGSPHLPQHLPPASAALGFGGSPGEKARQSGAAGFPRWLDSCRTCAEYIVKLLEKWQHHELRELDKHFLRPYQQHVEQCRRRLQEAGSRNVVHGRHSCFLLLEKGAKVASGLNELGLSVVAYKKDNNALACLSAAETALSKLLALELADLWRNGWHMPCYMRELFVSFRIAHLAKTVKVWPVPAKALQELVDADAIREVAPAHIVQTKPLAPPPYSRGR